MVVLCSSIVASMLCQSIKVMYCGLSVPGSRLQLIGFLLSIPWDLASSTNDLCCSLPLSVPSGEENTWASILRSRSNTSSNRLSLASFPGSDSFTFSISGYKQSMDSLPAVVRRDANQVTLGAYRKQRPHLGRTLSHFFLLDLHCAHVRGANDWGLPWLETLEPFIASAED